MFSILKQWVVRVTPHAVWILAILAALRMNRFSSESLSDLIGIADVTRVAVSHLDDGIVQKVHVGLFDEVEAGQVLLSLDDSLERVQLRQVEIDIERLRSKVLAEEAMLSFPDVNDELSRLDLNRRYLVDRETAQLDYLDKCTEVAREEILYRGVMERFESARQLNQDGVGSRLTLSEVETEADSILATIESKRCELESAQSIFMERDRRWFQSHRSAEHHLEFDSILTPLRLAIEVRQKDIEMLIDRIDDHVVRAPSAGQVVEVLISEGERVSAGLRLMAIAPGRTNRVVAYLTSSRVSTLRVGSAVSIQRPSRGDRTEQGTYIGEVSHMGSFVEEAPPRYQTTPGIPFFGRPVVVRVAEGEPLLPGELLRVATE